jgi:3-phenylpropionate/trans-cinnamate dioxygenase ferredoxin subunit
MSTEDLTSTEFVRVGAVSEYEQGVLRNHKVDGNYIAVVRNGERFYAMLNQCTHAGFLLTPGNLEGGQIYCPAHGAYFDPENGEPTSGPADDALTLYDVRIDGEDVLVAPRK